MAPPSRNQECLERIALLGGGYSYACTQGQGCYYIAMGGHSESWALPPRGTGTLATWHTLCPGILSLASVYLIYSCGLVSCLHCKYCGGCVQSKRCKLGANTCILVMRLVYESFASVLKYLYSNKYLQHIHVIFFELYTSST